MTGMLISVRINPYTWVPVSKPNFTFVRASRPLYALSTTWDRPLILSYFRSCYIPRTLYGSSSTIRTRLTVGITDLGACATVFPWETSFKDNPEVLLGLEEFMICASLSSLFESLSMLLSLACFLIAQLLSLLLSYKSWWPLSGIVWSTFCFNSCCKLFLTTIL